MSRGFTLIEIMVALTLGSMVLLIAHRVFSGVADGARRMSEARQVLDRASNARRWLEQAFGSLDLTSGAGGFAGRSGHVEFDTWQMGQGGWLEPARVSIERGGTQLTASMPGRVSFVLADSVADVQFDYLLEVAEGENSHFVREWASPVSAPLAVRIRIAYVDRADTLLLVVGPRG